MNATKFAAPVRSSFGISHSVHGHRSPSLGDSCWLAGSKPGVVFPFSGAALRRHGPSATTCLQGRAPFPPTPPPPSLAVFTPGTALCSTLAALLFAALSQKAAAARLSAWDFRTGGFQASRSPFFQTLRGVKGSRESSRLLLILFPLSLYTIGLAHLGQSCRPPAVHLNSGLGPGAGMFRAIGITGLGFKAATDVGKWFGFQGVCGLGLALCIDLVTLFPGFREH